MSEAVQDNETIAAPAGAKRAVDPGFSRNLKIIGAFMLIVVIVLVLIFALRSGGGDSNETRTSDLQLGTGNTQAAVTITPAMENMLREQQLIEAKQAASAGESYIPPDTTGKTVAVEPAQPIQASSYEAATFAQGQAAPVSEADQRRREGLDRQLAAFLGGSERLDSARVRISAEKEAAGSAPVAASVAGAAGMPALSGGGDVRQVVAGLEIVAGTLAGDLNVPAGRDVFASALVRSGPLNGAYLVGSARVVDESLEINFTQMRFGTKTFAIDAIVLDQATAANAIAGSVDRRVLQRYVLPITLAVAQGFFAAKAAVGSVAVSVGDQAGVATPAPSSEQARAAGVAEGIKIAGQEIQRGAQSPIIVGAPRGTTVGILFRAPVTEEIK